MSRPAPPRRRRSGAQPAPGSARLKGDGQTPRCTPGCPGRRPAPLGPAADAPVPAGQQGPGADWVGEGVHQHRPGHSGRRQSRSSILFGRPARSAPGPSASSSSSSSASPPAASAAGSAIRGGFSRVSCPAPASPTGLAARRAVRARGASAGTAAARRRVAPGRAPSVGGAAVAAARPVRPRPWPRCPRRRRRTGSRGRAACRCCLISSARIRGPAATPELAADLGVGQALGPPAGGPAAEPGGCAEDRRAARSRRTSPRAPCGRGSGTASATPGRAGRPNAGGDGPALEAAARRVSEQMTRVPASPRSAGAETLTAASARDVHRRAAAGRSPAGG